MRRNSVRGKFIALVLNAGLRDGSWTNGGKSSRYNVLAEGGVLVAAIFVGAAIEQAVEVVVSNQLTLARSRPEVLTTVLVRYRLLVRPQVYGGVAERRWATLHAAGTFVNVRLFAQGRTTL